MKMNVHGPARTVILRAPALALLAAFALSAAACKDADDVQPPAEPQASAQTEVTSSDGGTTTTFAPPAPEPQTPPPAQ